MTSLKVLGGAQTQVPQPAVISDYHVVHGWPALPEGRFLERVAGCAVDSHNDVFVVHRERAWPTSNELLTTSIADPTVALIDGRTGKLLAEWGANLFAMPHSVSVDAKDNVWITDVALHQVYKFSHDGKLLLTVGERGTPGSDGTHFNRPTKVTVAPDGAFFVSDGYRNTRVVKFSPEGKFLAQWGSAGSGPGQFNLPHAITLDSSGRLYVSDRNNSRVQIFDADGRFLAEWKGNDIGHPYDVAIAADGTAFVLEGGDNPSVREAVDVVNRDGHVLQRFGRSGIYDGQFRGSHCIAIGQDESVYVGDIQGGRIQKFAQDHR